MRSIKIQMFKYDFSLIACGIVWEHWVLHAELYRNELWKKIEQSILGRKYIQMMNRWDGTLNPKQERTR